MFPWKAVVALLGAIIALFTVALAVPDTCSAEPGDDKLLVQAEVPNNTRIVARLKSRLDDEDGIYVRVSVKGASISMPVERDIILIWANGTEVTVTGNSWVPQEAMDDFLYRNRNVSRNAIDIVMGIIQNVHDYQVDHPKPPPPPPPPVEQGPPPPPEPPFDWSPYMVYIYIGVPVLILFLIWLPLHLRYRRRIKRLATDADTQADWGYDQYGIKSSLDL